VFYVNFRFAVLIRLETAACCDTGSFFLSFREYFEFLGHISGFGWFFVILESILCLLRVFCVSLKYLVFLQFLFLVGYKLDTN
jgi:hypothetical protein